MFDKLLLPIDPSKRLRPARNYALALAQRLSVPLIATYVSNPTKTGTVTASKEARRGFEALGKRQLDQFIEETTNVKVEPLLKSGKRRKVLAQLIDEGIADTLVLGPFRSTTGGSVFRCLHTFLPIRCHVFHKSGVVWHVVSRLFGSIRRW